MTKNVGKTDRIVRVIIGLAIIAWGVTSANWLGVIGLAPLLTGIFQWCPAYCPFGISTKCGGCCGGGDSCSKP